MAKILILDDDVKTAEFCQEILEPMGHDVTTALSARQFIKCIHQGKYDLLISDINMPEMDGFICCYKVLKIRPEIKILIMTSLVSLDEVVEDILKKSPFNFLRKPFSMDTFAAAVKTALENKNPVRV